VKKRVLVNGTDGLIGFWKKALVDQVYMWQN